jgi:hypothetical protein
VIGQAVAQSQRDETKATIAKSPLVSGVTAGRSARLDPDQPIDFGDVMLTRGYNGTRAYCRSKLAQIMFTIDLGEADLQKHFGVSPPSVHQMVLTLERAGLIRRQPGVARSIEVLVPPELLPILR